MKTKIMALLVVCGVQSAFGDFTFWSVNTEILDNDPLGLQDTRELTGFSGVIQMLQVQLHFSAAPSDYAYNGDFYITLQHNSGFAVLLNRAGRTVTDPLGYDNNGFNITFSLGGNDVHMYQDYAPSYDGNGRLTGTWGVDGRDVDPDTVLDTSPRTDMLASFTGLDPNGDWTIFAADMNQNANAVFDSWGLNVVTIPEPGALALLGTGAILCLLRRKK